MYATTRRGGLSQAMFVVRYQDGGCAGVLDSASGEESPFMGYLDAQSIARFERGAGEDVSVEYVPREDRP